MINAFEIETNSAKLKREKKNVEKLSICCLECNFKTNKSSNYNRHITTNKHIRTLNAIYREKKKDDDEKKSDIIFLIKENEEIKQMIIDQNNTILEQNTRILELCKNKQTTNNITNHNTFNLNVFLNETCKDAMNIKDFIESIDIQIEDLIKVGKLGYVRGITDIIVSNLKKLDITKRPLHCSDIKRETMYIKDKDIWEKDTEQKERLRKVVKEISMANSRALPKFKERFPGSYNYNSKLAEEYDDIAIETLGGKELDIQPNQNRIMKNIAKEVLIEKVCV